MRAHLSCHLAFTMPSHTASAQLTAVAEPQSDAGGIRRVKVPPELAFGNRGFSFGERGYRHADDKSGIIPPSSTVDYELELVRVSIPP